jgi:single-strand DNA-binding protein
MPNFCNITVIGHLGRDPETRTVSTNDRVTSTSLAFTPYSKAGNLKPIWFKVEVWGKRGETLAQHVKKGDAIVVTGSLVEEHWNDKQSGVERSQLKINVNDWSFAGKKGGGASTPAETTAATDDDDSGSPF